MRVDEIYLMCGPSFSGKTTLARQLVEMLGCAYVGLDEINERRGLAGGFDIPPEEWAKTHEIALAELDALLAAGRSAVVADDTNCYRFLRDNYRRVAEKHGYRCRVIVMKVPEDVIWRRVAADEAERQKRGARDDLLAAHVREFEWPDADEDAVSYDPSADLSRWVTANLLGVR